MPGKETAEWTIGEVAKPAGLTVRTLRHYDRIGLLRPSRRASSGHRRYSASDVNRLRQILSFRSLGFSLAEITDLVNDDGGEQLLQLAQQQLLHVTRQLTLYQDLRERLVTVVDGLKRAQSPSTDQLLQILEVLTMTVHLSRIYTRAGDDGDTHLGDRTRVRKTDPRIEACGDIDELASHIGVAVASGDLPGKYVEWLRRIQNDLYDVGADLAVPQNDAQRKTRLRVGSEYVRWLEERCDEVNSPLQPLDSFVLPGSGSGAAQLHVCRTVCRRAERHSFRVDDANPEVLRYLNRLSDLLFILSRAAGAESDSLWKPGGHAPTIAQAAAG